MLSANIRKDPQAPGPVKTGDLMEVRCSWPDPLLIHTPGTLLKICLGCWASTIVISSEFKVVEETSSFQSEMLSSFLPSTIISSSISAERFEELKKSIRKEILKVLSSNILIPLTDCLMDSINFIRNWKNLLDRS